MISVSTLAQKGIHGVASRFAASSAFRHPSMMDREEQVALAHRVDVLRLSFFQNLRHNALLLGGAVDGFFQVRCVVLRAVSPQYL